MAILRILIVHIICTLLPFFALAAHPLCASVLLGEESSQSREQRIASMAYTKALDQLDKLKVGYKLSENPNSLIIRILESDSTELGRLASQVMAKYSAYLVIDPLSFVRSGYKGRVTRTLSPENSRRSIYLLGLKTLFEEGSLTRDPVVLHEKRHLKKDSQLRLRQGSPFYGLIYSEKKSLPDFINNPKSPYARSFHFDELRAFYSTLRIELLNLKKLSRSGEADEIKRSVEDIIHFSKLLDDLSLSSQSTIRHLTRAINKAPDSIEFKINGGYVFAEFGTIKADKLDIRASIPLVKADPIVTITEQNIGFLKDQLSSTSKVSQKINVRSYRVAQIMNDAKAKFLAGDEGALLEAATTSLRLLPLSF